MRRLFILSIWNDRLKGWEIIGCAGSLEKAQAQAAVHERNPPFTRSTEPEHRQYVVIEQSPMIKS